ncbi:uncharacterized protein LOC144005797 [Festucalex cinctus]
MDALLNGPSGLSSSDVVDVLLNGPAGPSSSGVVDALLNGPAGPSSSGIVDALLNDPYGPSSSGVVDALLNGPSGPSSSGVLDVLLNGPTGPSSSGVVDALLNGPAGPSSSGVVDALLNGPAGPSSSGVVDALLNSPRLDRMGGPCSRLRAPFLPPLFWTLTCFCWDVWQPTLGRGYCSGLWFVLSSVFGLVRFWFGLSLVLSLNSSQSSCLPISTLCPLCHVQVFVIVSLVRSYLVPSFPALFVGSFCNDYRPVVTFCNLSSKGTPLLCPGHATVGGGEDKNIPHKQPHMF